MAGYTELIKNFEKIRAFTRDFFIYGFKGRNDYKELSPRSYDNERRRIESYLSELIMKKYDSRGKAISISSNTVAKTANPLFKVWQTKSFTKTDCFLHFVIPDILYIHSSLTVGEIASMISENYIIEADNDEPVDVMTIRNKLNEYVDLGILSADKQGKAIYYSLSPNPFLALSCTALEGLETALLYYKNILPAGFIGHSICNALDSPFIYRQIFFAHILDDEILLKILRAIRNKQTITLNMVTKKSIWGRKTTLLPLKAISNTKTGRQYIAVYSIANKKFSTVRLDYVKDVSFGAFYPDFDTVFNEYQLRMKNSFSIMHQTADKLHSVKLLLNIDEAAEQYILERIRREGKGGTISKVDKNMFEYSIDVTDTVEMIPWLRTFIGRIISIEGSEAHVISQFKKDIDTMMSMYVR